MLLELLWTEPGPLAALTSQFSTLAIFGPIKQLAPVTNRKRLIKGGKRNEKEVLRPPKGTDMKFGFK